MDQNNIRDNFQDKSIFENKNSISQLETVQNSQKEIDASQDKNLSKIMKNMKISSSSSYSLFSGNTDAINQLASDLQSQDDALKSFIKSSKA